MRRVTACAAVSYLLFVLAGTAVDAVAFLWPWWFMLVLGLETRAELVATLALGLAATIAIGALFGYWARLAGSWASMAVSFAAFLVSIALLNLVAWNIAEYMDWPIGP